MMRRIIVLTVVLLAFGARPIAAADGPICRAVTLTDRATGEIIIGSEDIAVDYDNNLAYISAYDRVVVEDQVDDGAATIAQGGIYLLDLNDLSPFADSVTVEDLTAGFKVEHDFRPHGIDLWLGGDGAILHAINRTYVREGAPGDDLWQLRPAIERFAVGAGGALTHLATLRPEDNALMCSPNGLVSPDGTRLFVTNDHGNCEGFGKLWEETFGLAGGYLLYYDGEDFRRVAGDLAYPNGVVTVNGPRFRGHRYDDLFVYVSETRANKIAMYHFSELVSESEKVAEKFLTLDVPGSPDNFSWTQDGTLLLAVIPDLFDFVFYRKGWFGVDKMASRVAEFQFVSDWSVEPNGSDIMTLTTQLLDPEIIFEDDGTLISGATVMADARDVRLIGAVLDDHIVICQKEADPSDE